jgi:hypothetical protein
MLLLQWQYLIFLLPIAFGALYLLLMSIGGMGDHGADAGVDHDLAVDHDVAIDHDVAVEHDADLGHGAGEHDLQPSFGAALLGFIGLGKAPFSILLLSYCFVWGVAGLAAVQWFGREPAWRPIAIAAVAAVLATRYLAAGLARLIPSVETYSTPLRTLVGLTGEVLYEVTPDSGTVRVRDAEDNLRDVSCRVGADEPRIPAGTRVLLLRYAAATRVFMVHALTGKGPQ